MSFALFLFFSAGGQPVSPATDLSKPPTIRSGSISNNDYPRSAISRGEQGVVRVAFQVSAEGRVTACAVDQSSRSEALDLRSCDIVTRRLRFRPALDAAGRAVAGVGAQVFEWRIDARCSNRGANDICIVASRSNRSRHSAESF